MTANNLGALPRQFKTLTIKEPADLMFRRAPRPVRCGLDLEVGAGQVYPEINFTLPPMLITTETMPRVRAIYTGIIDNVLARSRDLGLAGLMVEFEQLPPMTGEPAWGAELTGLLKSALQ